MTNLELVFNMLAKASTTALHKDQNPQGYAESAQLAQQGGVVAGNARRDLEKHIAL